MFLGIYFAAPPLFSRQNSAAPSQSLPAPMASESVSLTVVAYSPDEHKDRLRAFHKQYFPTLAYSSTIYDHIAMAGAFSRLVFAAEKDLMLAAITCRIEEDAETSPKKLMLHVMTIAVAEEARGHGLASRLLTDVMDAARAEDGAFSKVHLHVQTSNKAALNLYRKLGFEVSDKNIVRDYYPPTIIPRDAYHISRALS